MFNKQTHLDWLKSVSGALILASVIAAAFLTVAAEPIVKSSTGPAVVSGALGVRTWKDADGKFSIRASFQDSTNDQVTLLKSDGSVLSVPLKRLSAEDIAYVKLHGNPDYLLLSAFGIDSYTALSKFIATHDKTQDIVDMLQAFSDCPLFSNEDRQRAKDQLPKWKSIVQEKRILFGKKWILASEHEKILNDEQRLLNEAWKLIENGQDKSATERLEQASKLHPLSIRADFTLGLMQALIYRHAPKADEYFNECVKRQSSFIRPVENVSTSNLAAALNNLAITEIRQAKHKEALKHLREAARLNPASPEILQNVGRYSEMVKSQRLKSVPPSMHEDLSNLFASMIVSAGHFTYQPQKGWLYMRLVDDTQSAKPKPDQDPSKGQPATSASGGSAQESTRRIVSGASGFVIQPEYVLTNRHVIAGADGYSILDTETQQTLPATLIAVSDSTDLALLKCSRLKGAPLPLAATPMRRGTDIIVFGFPLLSRFGATLKTTRGTVTGLPSKETSYMCMLDAAANTGNSGGPICDSYGQVIAVLTKGTTNEVHNYTFGIPAESIREFVRGQLPNYQSPKAPAEKMDWPDVDAKVGPSTVLVFTEKELLKTGIENRAREAESREGGSTESSSSRRKTEARSFNAFEDSWCMTCNGHALVECPNRRCANGTVKDYRVDQIGRNRITGERLLQKVAIRVACETCDGDGKVKCGDCTKGRE